MLPLFCGPGKWQIIKMKIKETLKVCVLIPGKKKRIMDAMVKLLLRRKNV